MSRFQGFFSRSLVFRQRSSSGSLFGRERKTKHGLPLEPSLRSLRKAMPAGRTSGDRTGSKDSRKRRRKKESSRSDEPSGSGRETMVEDYGRTGIHPPPDASPKRPFRRTTHAQSLFFRSDENEDEIHFIVKSGTNIATNKDRRGIVFPTAVFRSVAPPNFIESLSSSCYERFPFDFQ